MIRVQVVYHAMHTLEYFSANKMCLPFTVRLRIGWVLNGPLPTSSSLVLTCFKANIEQDYEPAYQAKSWYDMESHVAYKQVDQGPQQMLARMEYFKLQFFIIAKDTIPVCCGLMITSGSQTTFFVSS